MEMTADQRAALEVNLRSMSWKELVRTLMASVTTKCKPEELPPNIRRWLEFNRGAVARSESEIAAIQEVLQGIEADWFRDRIEVAPISGWVVTMANVLRDGARWWILFAERHDDSAPLLGAVCPAPATTADLRKLGKIVKLAGGNPDRELLRTGAITQADRDRYLAAGDTYVAQYGKIFYWWKA